MSYIVFARKYRPQAFQEIVGQSHITTTLENAISQGRVAHAYLFAGPRGIGKTTTARILAKAMNCEKGPTTSPCNKCASCSEITHGTNLDILEIDGASNRGIDEIRNLRENIKFAPSKGAFKIYIIDEVHMLTQEAFNALLKILEEPPGHVKFIFATTQAHKVPATILSRCQRFDFRRISVKDILASLKNITISEKLDVKNEVLTLIAKYADGSMRDAEVILDQITSFTKGNVGLEDVVKVLGIVDEDVLFGLSGAIKEKDPVSALRIIDRLVNDGKDVVQVIISLIEHFRNFSIVKISKDLHSLIDVGPEKIKRYETEAQKFSIEEILYIIYTLSNAIDFIRKSSLAKVPFEAAMIKLTRAGSVIPLAEIAQKVSNLEANINLMVAANTVNIRNSGTSSGAILPAKNNINDHPEKNLSFEKDKDKSPLTREAPLKSPDLDSIIGSWNMVINHIKTKKMSVALYLQGGYPVSMNGGVISIGFPKEYNFHKEALELPENRKMVEDCIKDVLHVDVKVKVTLDENAKVRNGVQENNPDSPEHQSIAGDDMPDKKEKDVEPIIKDAMEIFGGDIKESGKGGSK